MYELVTTNFSYYFCMFSLFKAIDWLKIRKTFIHTNAVEKNAYKNVVGQYLRKYIAKLVFLLPRSSSYAIGTRPQTELEIEIRNEGERKER